MSSKQQETYNRYTVVLRATECQFRIPEGRSIRVQPITSDYGPFSLNILTRTDTSPKFPTPVPRELWIEVTGPAPSLQDALRVAAAIATEFVRQVAFAANAWQGTLGAHLGFDSTDGPRDREFFQNWTFDEVGLPRPARQVDPDLMYRFLVAIAQASTEDRSRYARAIIQFTDALQYWEQGMELYALSHLYMGVEAITPTAIRQEVQRRDMKKRGELEQAVLELPKLGFLRRLAGRLYQKSGGFIKPPDLESWARRELIFRGDNETLKAARRASDMLEHGFGSHDDVQRLAVKCVAKSAEYLRTFIIDSLSLSDADQQLLKAKPYGAPARTSGFQRQVIATITSDLASLAAADQAYPRIIWRFDLHGLKVLESGSLEMNITQDITPSVGDDAKFRLDRIHFSGPNETAHSNVVLTHKNAQAIGPKSEPPAGKSLVEIDGPANTRWAQLVGSFILNVNSLRHLSWHWLVACGVVKHEDFPKFNFRETVELLMNSIVSGPHDEAFRAKCAEAWTEAVGYDEVRQTIAGLVVQPSGLLDVDSIEGTKASTLEDPKRLADANSAAVALAQTLVALFDEAMQRRTQPPPADAAGDPTDNEPPP